MTADLIVPFLVGALAGIVIVFVLVEIYMRWRGF